MSVRLAIIVTHPIQHFAPWHCELAKRRDIELKVFLGCDWGVSQYFDPEFKMPLEWDIPLLDGYAHEFLPIARRPERLAFWEVDNPAVGAALDRFSPDVVKVFGYAHRTNWRVAGWARRHGRPLMLYSDSNANVSPMWWKRAVKEIVVRRFYGYVDGALFVGDNNRAYHLRYGVAPERLFPGALPIERERLLGAVLDPLAARRDLRRTVDIPQDAFVVVFCGKYVERKRALDLARAAAVLADKSVFAVLIGEGPERSNLEAWCSKKGTRNVHLTGFVNQSVIPTYFAAADALAVTSSFDPHPLVVTEAATFGLPVIVSDRVGCIGEHDTARPGRNAIVYSCGDVQELARAIEMLRTNSDLRRRMGEESKLIAASQDVAVAAQQLAQATLRLHELGPRHLMRAGVA